LVDLVLNHQVHALTNELVGAAQSHGGFVMVVEHQQSISSHRSTASLRLSATCRVKMASMPGVPQPIFHLCRPGAPIHQAELVVAELFHQTMAFQRVQETEHDTSAQLGSRYQFAVREDFARRLKGGHQLTRVSD
jgi:hypothetical protein